MSEKPPAQVVGVQSVDSGFMTGAGVTADDTKEVAKGSIPTIRCPFCHKDVRSILSLSHQKACKSKHMVKCTQCGKRVLNVFIANGKHGEACVGTP